MKTNTILCSLLIAALPWRVSADSTLVNVPAGYSTIANNYNRGGNTLQDVLPLVASGTVIYKWNFPTQTFTRHDYDDLALVWTPNASLSPGEGAFIFSLAPQTITFSGTVPGVPGAVPRPASPGKRFVGDRWPIASDFQGITGYAPGHGDRVILYNGTYGVLPVPPSLATSIHLFSNGSWVPSLPLLAPWKSAFIDLVPLPLVLTCPTNKTVQCGTPWTFDPAVATSGACSNVSLVSQDSTNLTTCLSTYTRVWFATDCVNGFTTCTQIVTVVDTQPPGILCASNKTVACTAPWSFDPPLGSDFCCGTNGLTKVLLASNLVQSTTCQKVWAGTWQAGDCCGNFTVCTQYVTVVDSLAPVVYCPPNKTVTAGMLWNFDPPALTNGCCGTNVTVLSLETTTNGWCPTYLTHHTRLYDCCTNAFDCYQVVTVVSNCTNCLTIACPGDIRLPCAGLSDTPVTWTTNAANSCNPADLVAWFVPAPGSPFGIGSTPVTGYVSNSLGEIKTCNFTVTIFVPAPRLGGLRIPGPLGVPLLVLSWPRSCHDFGVEAGPLLGEGGPSGPGPVWSPIGGVPTGEWSQPNPTNNALDQFIDADVPLPPIDPADTGLQTSAMFRISDQPVAGVNFANLPLGSLSNLTATPSRSWPFVFTKPGGGDPEIISLDNSRGLRIGPEGLWIQCPSNFPAWGQASHPFPADMHEIQLRMTALPGSPPLMIQAFDTRNQLAGSLTVSNPAQPAIIQAIGYPIDHLLIPSTPGAFGGILDITGGGFRNPLVCYGPDYRAAPLGPVINPWPQPGVTLTSRLASGDLDLNTRIEDGAGGHGYHVEYSTEIVFNPCCRYVQILLVQDSGTGEIVARDGTGAVLGTYVPRTSYPLKINLGPFRAPSCRVTITATSGHARILRLCCSEVPQAGN